MKFTKLLALVITVVAVAGFVAFATETIEYGDAGAGPTGDMSIYNCQRYVSLDGINPLDIRVGFYAFTGEMIYEGVIVRNERGAENIEKTVMTVDEETEVLCNDYTAEFVAGGVFTCDDVVPADNLQPGGDAAGHMLPDGFDADTDKFFVCVLTVEPDWEHEMTVSVEAFDMADDSVYSTSIEELWYFNPEVTVDVDVTSGSSIEFEDARAGETAYSLNKLRVTNDNTESGVNLFVFLAASDLVDSNAEAAKCPHSNVLHVGCPEDVQHLTMKSDQSWIEDNILSDDPDWQLPTLEYLATSGTLQTGGWPSGFGLDGGLKGPAKEWKCVPEYEENSPCGLTVFEVLTSGGFVDESNLGVDALQWRCRNAVPVPDLFNILTAGSHMDVAFRLNYPMPCIGTFDQGQIFVIVQPV